jgi:putative intracellular protease/amidase
MSKRVLMITTSHRWLGDTGKATGVWAEELTTPYYALTEAGVAVTVASTAGGAIPLDSGSLKPKGQNTASVERMLDDQVLLEKLKSSAPVSAIDIGDFDALYFPGGHGTMWDLPVDPGVTQAVERAFAQDKIVATVCHGAAALVSALSADGQSVVRGLRVNSFTDQEEQAAGLSAVVPFPLETRLRALGGKFEGAANWQAFAIRDGQLITGQNPQSSLLVAQQVLAALDLISVTHP